ncbi:MAG: cupin domain-containing protein [Deltaproteobacteria bacterium]|nr:cupin domain-containing protein [Deltaproteobacteria bacterium]MBW2122707.1 cupin domain-containing protein [Deltaproteobacteria bacterium]
MEEVSLNYREMQWEEAKGYPPGTLMKVLRQDEKGEPLTIILKLAEGFDMEGHSHMGTEQHFVIEGEYMSENRTYGEGSYRLIPRKATHGPFKSEKGAVILVVWDEK